MVADPPFLIFDDSRASGTLRHYRAPVATVEARSGDAVLPALESLRGHLARGRHVAGFLAYEAGFALDPALAAGRPGDGPLLLWFGVFDGFDTLGPDDFARMAARWNGAATGPVRPRIAPRAYREAAERIEEHLHAGDIYQANLTFGCDVTVLGDPVAAYARLKALQEADWGGIVRHPDGWILSLSPEQFFTLRDGRVEARPMKGTAPRGHDAQSDEAAIAALRADPKQRAENLMIVDLLRNDLARIARTGSVAVPSLFAVETYPTLHQMVSRVTASLDDGRDAVDVLATIFPCGSITGAPKISAMRILAGLEPERRGAYTGSMGWIEPGGDAAFNVMIRTLELAGGSAVARLGLGSGLVVDSIAADEWRECLLKGEFVNRAARLPDLIETMRFDPQDGLVGLDRHLDRLRSSAAALGFRYDHHMARNELQAATFGRKGAGVARLLLSPTGAMAVELRAMDPAPDEPVRVGVRPLGVRTDDPRLRHKTTDRAFYDDARRDSGLFEILFTDPDGFLTEGSFTTLFVERGDRLITPPLTRAILPGILRAELIESGRAVEGDLREEDLRDGFFVGNMVRGLIRANLA